MFENLSFTILKGEKVAFFSEQSTTISALFDILTGKDTDFTGTVKWGKTITYSYLPKNYDDLFNNDLMLTDWLAQFSKEKDITYLRSWLGRMLFSGEEAIKQAKVLSGGEKVRCMFSKMMLEGGNVLLMDEPIAHLDLESIQSLNNGMKNFKGCILFTTSDQEILSTVANRIIVINNNKKEFDKQISYDEYISKN